MEETLKSNKFPKWIIVQAYKHDGKLHRQWSPAYLTEETDEYWALCSRSSLVVEADGRRWMTKESAVFFLFKKKWMNVICMMKDNGGICYYCNIASPTLEDNGYLKYIDYDLDVKLFGDGTIKKLDVVEFKRNALKYGYPDDLIDVVVDSMNDVNKAMKNGEFPFKEDEVLRIFSKFEEENKPFVANKEEDEF